MPHSVSSAVGAKEQPLGATVLWVVDVVWCGVVWGLAACFVGVQAGPLSWSWLIVAAACSKLKGAVAPCFALAPHDDGKSAQLEAGTAAAQSVVLLLLVRRFRARKKAQTHMTKKHDAPPKQGRAAGVD